LLGRARALAWRAVRRAALADFLGQDNAHAKTAIWDAPIEPDRDSKLSAGRAMRVEPRMEQVELLFGYTRSRGFRAGVVQVPIFCLLEGLRV
jgi:hypothetical protein